MAIDPGPHTGVAMRDDKGNLSTVMIHNNYPHVWALIVGAKPQVLIVERFTAGGNRVNKAGQETMEMVGACVGVWWMLNTPEHPSQLFFQTPGDRYTFIPTAREMLGYNKTKILSHEVDALAHLLAWEEKQRRELAEAQRKIITGS